MNTPQVDWPAGYGRLAVALSAGVFLLLSLGITVGMTMSKVQISSYNIPQQAIVCSRIFRREGSAGYPEWCFIFAFLEPVENGLHRPIVTRGWKEHPHRNQCVPLF